MSSTVQYSIIANSSAWVLSIITALISLLIPFIAAGVGSMIGGILGHSLGETEASDNMVDMIGYLITGIAVAFMCYKICRAHPESAWYTPVISNAMTILMAGNYLSGNMTLRQLLLTLGVGWVLSGFAAIYGRRVGLRKSALTSG